MNIQQVLKWIVMAIVMVVAILLLIPILQFGAQLLWLAVKVLLVLLLIAIVLRFIGQLQHHRR